MASDLEEGLRRSNNRFLVSISSILERYNQPFEDDFVISMESLTYDTPDGPKQWENVSTKDLKKWKKEIFECKRGTQRNAGGGIALKDSVKCFNSFCYKEKPDFTETSKQDTSDFEDGHSTLHQESPENSHVDTSDIDEENEHDIAFVRRESEDISSQDLSVDDGEIPKQVKVDVIVQDHARKIPEWITIAPQGSSESLPLSLATQKMNDNRMAVCRKKAELSREGSSLRAPHLDFSGVPISPNAVTMPRPSPELNKTCCDIVLAGYHSGDEECSWSNVTLADLYPAMVEILKRRVTKHTVRKQLKYLFGHLRYKRCCSRRPKFTLSVNKIRGFRPSKLKQALPSICSTRREDSQKQTFGNDSREFCSDSSYIDTNGIEPSYSDSSLEDQLVSGKGQKVSKQTVFSNVMPSMGETFLVEDGFQATVLLKSPEREESEKLASKCASKYHFITPTASSGSPTLQLVKQSKTPNSGFPCLYTSELCSSLCSLYGNSDAFTPVPNYSLAQASNTLFVDPEKITSESQISLQHKDSFSLLTVKPRPSDMSHKCEDAFEKLYYELCSKEIPKPLALRSLPSSSQNPEEKESLVKTNLSVSVRSKPFGDRAFDRIYEQLCGEAVPKPPWFQRASSLKKYEGLSETVNALVNSPVRALSASLGVKRVGNFPAELCSPVKRLRNIPECSLPSTRCQQVSPRRNINLQTVGMDSLCTYSSNNPSSFDSHKCQSQFSGFHAASDRIPLSIPGTSLQESGIADTHFSWPKGNEELTVVPKVHRSVTKEYPEN